MALRQKKAPLTATPFVPATESLPVLRKAALGCKGCDLWKRGTQTVFGEGGASARLMFIGEQPGDREDLAGKPFVGPAGRLLDEALAEAGIERNNVYVTNAVKHFSWEPDERGKRRIHKKPRAVEINACRPWLEAEFHAVQPRIVVCLGATAAQSLLGKTFSVTRQRGLLMESALAPRVVATMHPSAILRARDTETRNQQFMELVEDLRKVAGALQKLENAA